MISRIVPTLLFPCGIALVAWAAGFDFNTRGPEQALLLAFTLWITGWTWILSTPSGAKDILPKQETISTYTKRENAE